MRNSAIILIIAFAATACAGPGTVREDASPSPILSGDATAPVRACGNQPIVGFTYCRMMEGDLGDQAIDFIGPPAECDDDACVFVKVYDQAGHIAWGGSIPKGSTYVRVPWKELIGSTTLSTGMRGLWSYSTRVRYRDDQGFDRVSNGKGEIVLRVLKKGYQAIDTVKDDPNFVWSWVDNGYQYKMTSSMRTSIKALK